jgi:hypothetical protein
MIARSDFVFQTSSFLTFRQEPKHHANSAAIRAWERQQQRPRESAESYQDSRAPRRCSSNSQSTAATRTSVSLSTQRSSSNGLSQGSAISGSIYRPSTCSLASQLSSCCSTQSLTQSSQSTDGFSQLASQELFIPSVSATYSTSQHSSLSRSSLLSYSPSLVAHSTPRHSQSVSQESPLRVLQVVHETPDPRSCQKAVVLEIQETPPDRLLLQISPLAEPPQTQEGSFGTYITPAPADKCTV